MTGHEEKEGPLHRAKEKVMGDFDQMSREMMTKDPGEAIVDDLTPGDDDKAPAGGQDTPPPAPGGTQGGTGTGGSTDTGTNWAAGGAGKPQPATDQPEEGQADIDRGEASRMSEEELRSGKQTRE